MKRLLASLLTLSCLSLAAAACGDDDDETPNTPDSGTPDSGTPDAGPTFETVEVSNNITADTTWRAGNTYILTKYIFVEGGTLTIEAGASVKGNEGSALIITRNARINAVGTAEKPIVFTSSKEAGQREAGDWGGVVLLGRARLNVTGGETTIEGFFASGTTSDLVRYGGTDDAHNCGTLTYARVEFAGFELAPNNELNGLTLGGCGSATNVDYVQVHKGLDDGIELFGGTAPLKHIVITQADDDALDYDLGYSGKIQFLVVQQSPALGDRGIEASSSRSAPTQEPISIPEIWNATFIGSGAAPGGNPTQEGLVFNTGAGVRMRNSIIAHWKNQAVDIDGTASAALFNEAGDSRLSFKNVFFWDIADNNTAIPFAPNPVVVNGTTTDPDATKLDESQVILSTATKVTMTEPAITDPLSLTAPNFAPAAGSAALNADAALVPGSGFDATARFIGAVGSTDWTKGWTAYPER